MNPKFRYQDFVDQQRSGFVHGVFIDDTGSPGLWDTPGLHPQRKSWVAVLVPKIDLPEIWSQIPRALDELNTQTGADEFHFTDIYAGRGEFKNVPLHTRLALFQFMAYIFGTYAFPVFVQTLDPDSLREFRSKGSFPERIGPFNLTKHEDLALFFLLLRVKWYLQEHYSDNDRLTRVFVDEGYKQNGAAIYIPPLERIFADGLICFARSDTILPLQLADFAAFCLNRTQLLIGKSKITELDEHFLRIIQPLAWNFQNIPKVFVDASFWKGESLKQ